MSLVEMLMGAVVVAMVGYIVYQYWPAKKKPPHLEIYSAGYRSITTPDGFERLIHAHNSNVEPELRKAIAVGAVLNEQNSFPMNRIETGRPPEEMQAWVGESWDIHSGEDARYQIQHLFEAGHREILDRVATLYTTVPADELHGALRHEFNDYPEPDLSEFVDNVAAVGPKLVELGRLGTPEDLPAFGALAYDLGRAVTVSRVAASAGYIEVGEAETYCRRALEVVEATFPTWSSFATSYLVGRGIWGGVDDPNFMVMNEMVEMLLTHEQSPWLELPLRSSS